MTAGRQACEKCFLQGEQFALYALYSLYTHSHTSESERSKRLLYVDFHQTVLFSFMFFSDLPLKFSYIHPTVGGCFRCSKIACALYFVVCFCFCVTFSMLAARLFTRYRTCFFWDRHENLLTQAYACYTVNIVHSLRCGSTQTPFGAKRSLSLFNLVKSK